MYFKIRLNRVEKNLKEFADQTLNPVRRESLPKKRYKKTIRRPFAINDVVLDLQETLDELYGMGVSYDIIHLNYQRK